MTTPAERNRAWWEERAALHGHDGVFYDIDGFVAGDDAISERELAELEAAVGELARTRVLHLQCHLGLGTLSLARRGAVVTGLDFSPTAVAKAREVAARAGLAATFVLADVHALPDELVGGFDAVFASYGVIMWSPSMGAWMRSAARALVPGGALVLVDGHPIAMMVRSSDPPRLDGPYLGATPVERVDRGSYTDPDAATVHDDTVLYRHGLGEIVTAAAAAGLVVEAITEFMDEPDDGHATPDDRFGRSVDGRVRMPFAGADLPVQFSLRARKPR